MELKNMILGHTMPTFALKDVVSQTVVESHALSKSVSVIAFICNHCPYAVGSIAQLNETLQKYVSDNTVKAVFISSNDPVTYPADGPEKMAAFHEDNKLCVPYLFDDSQDVARSFGAQCTPELFVFSAEGKLIYQGATNDSPRDATKVTQNYLEEVLRQATQGDQAVRDSVRPMGCSIKWKA